MYNVSETEALWSCQMSQMIEKTMIEGIVPEIRGGLTRTEVDTKH